MAIGAAACGSVIVAPAASFLCRKIRKAAPNTINDTTATVPIVIPAISPLLSPLEEENDSDIETDTEPDIVGKTSPNPDNESEFVTRAPCPRFDPLSALAKGRTAVPVTKDKGTDDVAQYKTDSPTAVLVSVTQEPVAESVQARHEPVDTSQITFGG